MSKIKLYKGNCLSVLPKLDVNPEKCVIITSPPYNMNLRVSPNKIGYRKRGFENSSSEKIATKYVNYRDDMLMDDYYSFQEKFIKEALEKSSLCFYIIQMVTGNKPALLKLLGTFSENIKEIIIWDKGFRNPAVRKGCLNSCFEFIIIFSKDASRRCFNDSLFDRGKLNNVWKISAGKHSHFKASFPEELVQNIVTNFIEKDFTIIDPFMGSGTTGVVSIKNNIDFIGIELDEGTYNLGKERILEVCKCFRTH